MLQLAVSVIAVLALAICALGFFWLFRADKLRRAAYAKKQAKFHHRTG